jgi:hypothetical protein
MPRIEWLSTRLVALNFANFCVTGRAGAVPQGKRWDMGEGREEALQ